MFTLEECTVADIQRAFKAGELTSAQLTGMYMKRIAHIDKSGPSLHSIIEINPDALHIAQAMDRQRQQGSVRSPLHGIPVVLKDNINTCDKMHTSAGSLALADNYAPYDASLVTRLRDAGLVILGKANMTELANFMSDTMKSGYSSRGGQVINPYKPGAEVWGSSTGSAVSVSANLCALSVGTETDGSIIAPSFINGCVGIKPTLGLISRHGIIPVCTAQDTAGPMARTVADAAALLNILVGTDENDPATWYIDDKIPSDYTAFLHTDGLSGLRLGINWCGATLDNALMPFTDEHCALARDAIQDMKKGGAVVIDSTNLCTALPDRDVMLYEFQQCLNAYLSSTSPSQPIRSLLDIIHFYAKHPKEGLKYGMSILLDAQFLASHALTDPVYIDARMKCIDLARHGLDRIFSEYELDLLVTPMFSGLAPVSGYPSICVPAGYCSDGTPYGITFIGRAYDEPRLIAAAYAYEQISRRRKQPVFAV